MSTRDVVLTINSMGGQVYGYVINDMVIYNPRVSSCGRFDVQPSMYGLTDSEVRDLELLNEFFGYEFAV
jgi:hypothetical protein